MAQGEPLKKIFSVAFLAAFLVSCSGGGVGNPPPTPTPGPTSTPSGCGGALAVRSAITHRSVMYPRGKYPAPLANPHLSYGGGPLLISPIVYDVFWGYSASDPVAKILISLGQHVGGSGWFNTVTQYCNAQNQPIQNIPNMLGGVWSDTTDPVPAHPTQDQIAAEAELAAKHFAIGTVIANATVVIATPTGRSEVGFGTQFCGWHDYTGANGLSYEYIPYMPDAGASCGAGSVQGPLDGVSIVAGHELAESTTDPQPPSGWVDSGNGQEIADLCAWKDLQEVNLTGLSLPMQPLFDNASNSCVQ